ncbi:tetratricopeptide repeat protein [Alloactinosynnema sp. L-07]|uniref:tetratricopeptide repeat protein n=1 Tax=Alloactinosynnema sp. L-07 TaxID=1653480 RepID=UPI00155F74CC|nr:tetratricopeptide repeat protein [Alloactinosynnema sp. L-07]
MSGELAGRHSSTYPQGPSAVIEFARARLKREPDDARVWAELGIAYVEQARITADPTYYTKAEGALRKALDLRPEAPEDQARAQTGMGTLANARHEFGEAERWAEQARRLDPGHWMIYGVLTDARLLLGDRPSAEEALQTMMDLRPGVASYTRAAHYLSVTGNPKRAAEALDLAVSAAAPDELAFCHERMGELLWHTGQPSLALAAYERALAADPRYAAAQAGRGRARAALGQSEEALRDYTASVERAPHPAVLLELGELSLSLGRTQHAEQQFALFEEVQKLFRAGGVSDGLLSGRYESDHGDPATAVRLLSAEWDKAQTAETADALGWAMHRAGQHTQALPYARQASEWDSHRAEYAYHRGEIERALDLTEPAREHLSQALRLNPHFSPLHAPQAKAALNTIG